MNSPEAESIQQEYTEYYSKLPHLSFNFEDTASLKTVLMMVYARVFTKKVTPKIQQKKFSDFWQYFLGLKIDVELKQKVKEYYTNSKLFGNDEKNKSYYLSKIENEEWKFLEKHHIFLDSEWKFIRKYIPNNFQMKINQTNFLSNKTTDRNKIKILSASSKKNLKLMQYCDGLTESSKSKDNIKYLKFLPKCTSGSSVLYCSKAFFKLISFVHVLHNKINEIK